ncbi:Acyltransferase family protein [Enterococcus malodoratus]|nr:Acyltransferase family protein [Enterococcus malodoratus]
MERNQWINLRGVAILSVNVIHATTLKFFSSNEISNMLNLFLDQIARFAVPVFFMTSGYGLATKYSHNFSVIKFYKKRLKVIPAYLIWTVIYFFISSDEKNLKKLLSDVLYGKASDHLYFIVVLVFFYFLYPFLKNIAPTKIGLILFVSVSIIGQLYYQLNSEWGYPYV